MFGFPPRTNLLVEMTTRELQDERLFLSMNRYSPEGLGYHEFLSDTMEIPADRLFDVVKVDWRAMQGLPGFDTRFWLLHVWEDVMGNYVVDDLSVVLPLQEADPKDTHLRHLELFSGAFAGWKQAGNLLKHSFGCPSQTVAIELDASVSKAYAISHGACWTHTDHDIPADLLTGSSKDWIFQGSFLDTASWKAIATWHPSFVSLSSPCPPWSGAGTMMGLRSQQGKLLPLSILVQRWFRPEFIGIEQVSGFATHAEKGHALKTLAFIGYKLLWQKVLDLSDVAQPSRKRWIALAVRIHGKPTLMPPEFWEKVQQEVFVPPTLPLTDLQRQQLTPDENAIAIASDPAMSHHPGTPAQTLERRISDGKRRVPTFMALYGSQHTLPPHLLRAKKYLGHFVADEAAERGFRHWHPAEICLMHGVESQLFLEDDMELSWHSTGNMISVQHALVPMVHAVNCLQLEGVSFLSLPEVIKVFTSTKLKASEVRMHVLPHGYMLSHADTLYTQAFADSVTDLFAGPQPGLPVWDPDVSFRAWSTHEANPVSLNLDVALDIPSPMEVDETASLHPVMLGSLALDCYQEQFWFSDGLTGNDLALLRRALLRFSPELQLPSALLRFSCPEP
eukprot:Skav215150  [mRNA]  locus=scaffold2462:114297:117247:- [translate_table: standard]